MKLHRGSAIAVGIFLMTGIVAAEKKPGESDMNKLGERYVHLVLAMGQHDADYVDAFYGPAEWKAAAEKEKKPLDAIREETKELLGAVSKLPAPLITWSGLAFRI